MSINLIFWMIMLLWLLFGLWGNWPLQAGNRVQLGSHVILWVLLALLGWKVFGAAIHN